MAKQAFINTEETAKEAALILARLGMESDRKLEVAISRALGRSFYKGVHALELRIARWGDINAAAKKFILRDWVE